MIRLKNPATPKTIYFDNAATTFPKPPSVVEATLRGIREYSGNPGRGGHSISRKAAEALYTLRVDAAEFFGSAKEENVVITQNTTHSMNLALRALLRYGDSVLCSNLEHNAVRRVLLSLRSNKNVRISTFDGLLPDAELLESMERSIKKEKIDLVVLPHASNVCSRVLPLSEIGKMCRRHSVLLVVDGAQSAGHVPTHFDKFGIDALCLSGHKGLYSPPGIGLLMISDRFKERAARSEVLITGGAGVDSLDEDMPSVFPERFEAGTISAPLCHSLSAGIKFIKGIGIEKVAEKELLLGNYARNILLRYPGVVLYAPDYRGGIISFNLEGIPPERAAEYFDSRGICMRAGLHCAPSAHESLGSLFSFGGTLRMSFGVFNTLHELDLFERALRDITLK